MAKMSREVFVLKAVEVGRTGRAKGLHSEGSGLRGAFAKYFGVKANMVKTLRELEREGKVSLRVTKGGLRVYRPQDAPPPTRDEKAGLLLAAIRG